jgi:hypothetical protein
MARCIKNVFEAIPPERTDRPSRDELTDATISIQSFIFNVFGAVNNLAWIWMAENGQKRRDGTPIRDAYVGLGPDNTAVRGTRSRRNCRTISSCKNAPKNDPWINQVQPADFFCTFIV